MRRILLMAVLAACLSPAAQAQGLLQRIDALEDSNAALETANARLLERIDAQQRDIDRMLAILESLRYRCQATSGAQGVSFGQKCWPLDTTRIDYGDIPSDVRRQITDAGPVSGLTQLQGLDLTNTQVRDLAPLSSLTGLHYLRTPDGKEHGEFFRNTPANRAAVAEAVRTWRPAE